MGVLRRYFTRIFLARFLLILFAIAIFVLGFELIEVSKEILVDSDWRAPLVYAYLRLPFFLAQLLPIASLLAALLTFGELLRHREMIAVWNAGLSPFGTIWLLLPLGIALGVLQFVLNDQILPPSAERLRDWGVGDFARGVALGDETNGVWLLSGNDIVRLPASVVKDHQVAPITIFRRDDGGMLQERIDAAEAQQTAPGDWRLGTVIRRTTDGSPAEKLPELDWHGSIDLAGLSALSRPPRELSLNELHHLIDVGAYGLKRTEALQTWFYARLSQTLAPMLMLFLAVALTREYSRLGSFARLLFTGVGLGFALFAFDGATVALGEVRLLPPLMAAFLPPLVAAAIILHQILQSEPSASLLPSLGRSRK